MRNLLIMKLYIYSIQLGAIKTRRSCNNRLAVRSGYFDQRSHNGHLPSRSFYYDLLLAGAFAPDSIFKNSI